MRMTRREAVAAVAATLVLPPMARGTEPDSEFWLATFSADVTVPLGHALMGGGIAPAARVDDPLLARGVILGGRGVAPVVICGVDWCEIRNEAYDRWRQALADALRDVAPTSPARVLVSSLHQHDAPVADLEAERILRERQLAGSVCDPEFHEQAVARVAQAARESLDRRRRVTHFGIGQAEVERVASNRRYTDSQGRLRFDRTSASRDPEAARGEVGNIDPWLKSLSFWDEDVPLAALSHYATHPMSFYGQGGVSSDFVGLARRLRQQDDPDVFQMYLSGCSGNVTAGKHNDGSPENRPALAKRLSEGMRKAFASAEVMPLTKIEFRCGKLQLTPRDGEGFSSDDLQAKLSAGQKPFTQCLAAMGLSWRHRVERGEAIDVPVLDLGRAAVILLPGESYVEYQQLAQAARPDQFVMAVGYGECATGYVPIDRAWEEHDTNLGDWCWVAPGAEVRMETAIRETLRA